jgi:hypothetical protein
MAAIQASAADQPARATGRPVVWATGSRNAGQVRRSQDCNGISESLVTMTASETAADSEVRAQMRGGGGGGGMCGGG